MRFLILSEFYINNTEPISNCINSLTKGFDEIGISYDVVCFGNKNDIIHNDGNNIYIIKYLDSNNNIFKRLINWPIDNKVDIIEMYKIAKYIIETKQIDCVVAVHCNYVSVKVALMLKTSIKKVIYLLDPINAKHDKYYSGLKKILYPILLIKEFYAFLHFNYIVCMKSMKSRYCKSYYNFFKDKIFYNDFPLLNVNLIQYYEHSVSYKDLKFVTFGGLVKSIRSPLYFLNLFKKLNSIKTFTIDTFIQGNCADLFNYYSKYIKINMHSYVNSDVLMKELVNFDILINVGNKITDMLPSKIFQMFMTGKPIIHFAKSKDDCCNEYMERYGNTLIIYEEDDLDYSLNRLLEFLKDYKIVPIEKVKEIFKENTPKYQANLIKELVLDN